MNTRFVKTSYQFNFSKDVLLRGVIIFVGGAYAMGELYRFNCTVCGFKAIVSGGKNAGLTAVTQTMICRTCYALVDVVIRSIRIGREEIDRKAEEAIGFCPRCNGTQLLPWAEQQPCPKCGEKMKKGKLYAMWD
jgi:hypothetical protein